MSNQYYEWNDGWFEYYINEDTGERKLELEPGDVVVTHKFDSFDEISKLGGS